MTWVLKTNDEFAYLDCTGSWVRYQVCAKKFRTRSDVYAAADREREHGTFEVRIVKLVPKKPRVLKVGDVVRVSRRGADPNQTGVVQWYGIDGRGHAHATVRWDVENRPLMLMPTRWLGRVTLTITPRTAQSSGPLPPNTPRRKSNADR